MREYKASLAEYNFFIKFQVYESNKGMLKGATKYLEKENDIEDAAALFCVSPKKQNKNLVNKDKKCIEYELGKLFFCSESLTHSNIAHECVHAALEFFRSGIGYIGNFYNSVYADFNEEFLNMIFTDLYAEILIILAKNNYKIKKEITL